MSSQYGREGAGGGGHGKRDWLIRNGTNGLKRGATSILVGDVRADLERPCGRLRARIAGPRERARVRNGLLRRVHEEARFRVTSRKVER